MTVLVDSWAWIEFFKGSAAGKKAKESIENSQDKVIISSVNIAEVYNSFLRDYSPPNNKRYAEASKKAMKQRSYVYEVNEEIAVDSAKREDAKVLTGDPHFRGLKDVIFLEKEKI